MEIFIFLNFYFLIILSISNILKIKYSNLFENYTLLDIYLYLVLYCVVFIIILATLDLILYFHIFFLISAFFFLVINFKTIHSFNLKKFLNSILILNFFLILTFNKEFIWWDEFSSWGLRTKEILTYNSIFYENIITNLNKPSGINLLHYIFLKYIGFNESVIIFSQFSITILLLINIFNDFKVKNNYLFNLFIFLTSVYFISFIFNYGLFSIYTGVISAILFIKIITIFLIKNSINIKEKIFVLFPVIFLIVFFKDFSLFYLIYIFLILLISFLDKEKRKINFSNLKIFLTFVFVTIIFQKFTKYKLEISSSVAKYDIYQLFDIFIKTKINLTKINSINIFQGSLFRIPNEIIEKIFFKNELLTEIKTNLIFWLFFFFLMNIILFFLNKEKFKKKSNLFTTLYIFIFLHCFLILCSYNIYFGAPEASAMASFGRYMGLYLMPYLIFLLYNIYNYKFKIYKLKFFLLFLFLIIAPAKSLEILIPDALNKFDTNMKLIKNDKKNIKQLSDFILNNYQVSKIYILINNDDGFVLNMFKIYLYPKFVNKECWSFKKNVNSSTYLFSCNYGNNKEILNRLKGYDLIINYNKNSKYDKILNDNNFTKEASIFNSNIYIK